jgi:hypothetical protein
MVSLEDYFLTSPFYCVNDFTSIKNVIGEPWFPRINVENGIKLGSVLE